MHNMFICYHHDKDQCYKDYLVDAARQHRILIDGSVNTGDIENSLPDEHFQEIIGNKYLRDSAITMVIVGQCTKHRKHVDWETYSSMFDGTVSKTSGILVISLPGTLDYFCQGAEGR